ncbi:glucans biosynthesis glucosyltransferase MdoH [Cognatiyoonia sp. IB215446]|uniref:glucans biosynthesis glucosyltransferase MdoH n=1 Tax=Cognatiyoonia sp. IB215446 TaxID=3097355 RepID=UPI002A0F89E0|nr:glucans biosynthesis glucosyltransferase MdoH [Cognatiyoonia sp. IB215446]MDX8349392.1 glucans biosynthesis glucosyltransferase MdoH [Cognatiyoonia sp. IB215446]
MTRYAASFMPDRAPLHMPAQTFAQVVGQRALQKSTGVVGLIWRLAAFIPTIVLTVLVCVSINNYLGRDGVMMLEGVVLALVALTFVWLTFSVNTACLGIIRVALNRSGYDMASADLPPANIALLVPIYHEEPWAVFGNASAMLKELTENADDNRYTLYILSDTRDPRIAALEERAFAVLQLERHPRVAVHYRRRLENTDKKIGNLYDWIENWGAAHEAMIVLDADSLMSGPAIQQLARALAGDPDAGLIQSRPMLIGAQTLFGRVQQFSNSVYGWLLAEGLASWSQHEGNYWGHNAIIRTKAFAESARLPNLKGWRGREQLILSHDFVEAGMLRRAGWTVRLLPQVDGSFEETPQTLIDYILRDQRWCHGNMQHLRLLATRGFHMISRIHLLQGAMAFLMSPVWLAVVILWSFLSVGREAPASYFSMANPLLPVWPEQELNIAWVYLFFVYGMLLFPKLFGALLFGFKRATRAAYSSTAMYVGSILVELVLSVLYAPIMMVQHTIATLSALLGRNMSWLPQNRGQGSYGWLATLKFHWVETVLGLTLMGGIIFADVSVLILPIAVSLAFAVPLSRLSAWPVANVGPRVLRLDTPHSLDEPLIVRSARNERAWMKSVLSAGDAIAAE